MEHCGKHTAFVSQYAAVLLYFTSLCFQTTLIIGQVRNLCTVDPLLVTPQRQSTDRPVLLLMNT